MCGIAGILSLNTPITDSDIVIGKNMTGALRHRGPDSSGEYCNNNCYLGNTRLKIIDLSDHGDLPITNSDQSIWLAYNGEVTNYQDLALRYKLKNKYQFKSTSDSEVVLYLYQELGIECLKELSGMFAMTIYDRRKQKAYVIRDHFGIRPVFYTLHNEKLYFASELKSFFEINDLKLNIDHEAMYHYFSLIYIPGELTPYKGIKELDGGHYLEIDFKEKKHKCVEYYELEYKTDHNMTEKQAADGFYDVMLDSMRRNLISDAPLGLTLSGGIDTSTMLSLAKELGQSQKIHTYSIKVNESSFDESKYQKTMVDYAKPIHHEVVLNPEDVLENMIVQMAYMDEPNGNGAVIPSFILAKEAKKDVKVLLSGEGGDEITNAYDTHLAYKVRKLYRQNCPAALRKIFYKGAHCLPTSFEKLSFDFKAKRFTEGAEKGIPEAHLYWRHVFKESEKKSLLKPSSHNYASSESIFADMFNNSNFDDDLNKISKIDLKYFFIGDLMVKNDRTFMAHSVEARFPFADRLVFEFASKIPPDLRIKGFTPRYIQKMAMKKILPKKIFNRSSMGLEMPHSLWFFKGLEKIFDKYLTKENLEKAEIFNVNYVHQLWQEHKARKKDNGRALWSIINYLIWFDLFIYNGDYRKYLS